jgi:hypothetical protein
MHQVFPKGKPYISLQKRKGMLWGGWWYNKRKGPAYIPPFGRKVKTPLKGVQANLSPGCRGYKAPLKKITKKKIF